MKNPPVRMHGAGYPVAYQGYIDAGDNEVHSFASMYGPGKVVHVTFDTEGALGSMLSCDLVDGGSDGAGTDVILAGSDNLNGVEEGVPSGNAELADGDYLNILVDNITAQGIRVNAVVRHSHPGP